MNHIITDEMVERAVRRAQYLLLTCHPADIRDILYVALNPPTEPEIPVSVGMIDAALYCDGSCEAGGCCQALTRSLVAKVYRAMERKRREEENKEPLTGDTYRSITGQWMHIRKGDGWYPVKAKPHRRSTDK